MGYYEEKYCFYGKYISCPFKRGIHVAFHAAVNTCCDMIFYLSKVSFTDFGPGELNESMPCGFVYLYL